MKAISLRNVPENVYAELQIMAKQNRRSLQKQITLILEQEVKMANRSYLATAAQWRKQLGNRRLGNGVKMVREDRGR